MNCTINDLNLSFDKNNRLRTTIGRVTGFDINKAYVLASFFQDAGFKKYLSKKLTTEDLLDKDIDLANIKESDFANIKQNKLGALLNVYYLDNFHSVNNSKTKKGVGSLSGFTTASAKTTAKIYTGNLIVEEYYKELEKPYVEDKNRNMRIIQAVNNKILKTFYDRVNAFAENVINTNKYNKEAKDYAKKYLDLVKETDDLLKEYKDIIAQMKGFDAKNIKLNNTLKEVKTEKEKENIKKQIDNNKESLKKLQNNKNNIFNTLNTNIDNKYIIAQNLINLYTSDVDGRLKETLRNYANLVSQTRGDTNGWYFQVFNTKTMTSIIKEFNNIGDIEEYIEALDEDNDEIISKYNGESIDETSKSWEDHLYKSFNQAISKNIKIQLANIKQYEQRFNPNADTQSLNVNNELGVPMNMDYGFVTAQIFSFGNFNNVDEFIRSIERKSQSVKSLYGLGELVNKMKKDTVFANEMFANFAKPIIDKTILNISNTASEEGITFDISNVNAKPITEMVFRITNKIRSTYNSNYNIQDITKIDNIINTYKEDLDINKLKNDLYAIISKYIPGFNKDVYNNYFDNNIENLNERLDVLNVVFRDILNGINQLKTKINNNIKKNDEIYKNKVEQYNKDIKEYNELIYKWNNTNVDKRGARPVRPEFPSYDYVDIYSYDLNPTIYKGIFNFSKEFVEHTEARVRLNSTNAEGNQASDVIKNCFVTRFFEQIMAESEDDSNTGLNNLLKYLTQGENDGIDNQYANNPLFFGVKDINGNVIVKGMFSKDSNGYTINKNVKHMLKLSLFDGIKYGQNGAGYASLTKTDYFITQYLAFTKSVKTLDDNKYTNKIEEINTGVYSMRIASDAPKMFFIRAPKYTNNEATFAIYNHVINELNMLCNALNNVFVQEGDDIVTTKEIKNLIGRAYYDERIASDINNKKEKDFTKALVKNGKLVGNMFKLNRLFAINDYNANIDIEAILSLYGGVDSNALIIPDKDGRLKINKNRINENSKNQSIIYSDGKFKLNLNLAQKEQLKKIVDEWIEKYLADSNVRIQPFLKTMDEVYIKYDKEVIKNFLLNEVNINMCYDDMFEGDYKYYTNSRDFLKRTKEVQAGGDAYSGYNNLEFNDGTLKEVTIQNNIQPIQVKNSNNGKLVNLQVPTFVNGTIENKGMTARNGWRAVTIYNTIKASDYAVQIQETLEKIFIEQGMSEEKAKQRSITIAKGYGYNAAEIKGEKTKINDAQSYITLEEFIRRKHADGTINQYQDLIGKLLDPNISAEEIDLDEVNARIQIQKNFYYDKIYDPKTGNYYPRQIKNAEFVLIPKLLPEDFELRKVYDWMIANDIGQLNTAETSKAAKKAVFTIWDSETGEFNENFADEFEDSYVENYFYQYLYKQQDVPQHLVDAKNKAGIQIMKKIIDNIIVNDENVNKELKKYVEEFQDAYTANIEDSFNLLLDKFGWTYDAESGKIYNAVYPTTDVNGNILPDEVIQTNKETLNFEYFYQLAREEAARVGRDSNFIEYLIPNEFGDTTMPNCMSNVQASLESIAQSIYNGTITRQTLPGWHAAQITGVGYSKKLKFDAENGIMEVYLPRWSKLIPKGKNAEEDAKILEQIQKEGLDIHIGYRIPTEGKQSISVLKIVGFTNECLGSTIVVPDEWVTQTGSDFDVDSVYGISWEMYTTNKNGKIIVHKIPYEEDKVKDEDLYINYVQTSIENKEKKNDIGEEIKNNLNKIKNEIINRNKETIAQNNKIFNELDEKRNELFLQLPNWARGISKDVDKKANKVIKEKGIKVDIKETYPEIINKFTEYLENHNVSEEQQNVVNEYIDYLNALIEIMQSQEGITIFDKKEYRSKKSEEINKLVEKAKLEFFDKIQNAAKEANLLSFEEFKKLPHVKKLSRRARNNYILDRMIKIMNDKSSREEQYGRSNFETLDAANKKIDDLSGESDKQKSPYNVLDQLDYFEDALGGARLKALSVQWDTFISKNNKLRTTLNDENSIEVILNVEDKSAEDSEIIYDENIIRENYNDIENYSNKTKNEDINIEENINIKFPIIELKHEKVLKEEYGLNIPHISKNDRDYMRYYFSRNIILGNNEYNIKEIFALLDTLYEFEQNLNSDKDVANKMLYKDFINRYPNKGKEIGFIQNALDGQFGFYKEFKYKKGEVVLKRSVFKLLDNLKNINPNLLEDINIAELIESDNYLYDIIDIINANTKINDSRQLELNFNKQSNSSNKQILFKANRIGWSNNNRNITGDIITSYASQTTAHHLDAVKMGSVKNVNEYTFNVYKLLSSLGLDYEFVIGFIRQPAIKMIVDNNNLINSIFMKDNNYPIKMSIIDILNKINVINNKKEINNHTRLADVIDNLKNDNNFTSAFNKLFNIDLTNLTSEEITKIKVPLDKNRLFTRIKREKQNKGNIYENLAFDFAMILNFNNYKATADKINDYITVTNADKFGAKQSIHETREIFNKVSKLRESDLLIKDGVNFIDLIYPLKNLNDEYSIDVDKSEYKSIAAVYKYSTLSSLITNKEIFITENDDFNIAIEILQSNIGHKLNNAEYKEFKKYIMNYLYNDIEKLLMPLTIDKRGRIMLNTSSQNDSNIELITAKLWNSERNRICGYGITYDSEFTVKDINNPTEEEINEYNKLTPAQKVLFIQKYFGDNQGLFNYIKITMFNANDAKLKGISRQYLSFDDQIDDIENLYMLFNNSFYNHNPLIKLAAIDLVKYAFIAEGYNFKSGYITKIIPNNILYNNINDGGFDIIDEIKSKVNKLPNSIANIDFAELYVRSHPEIIKNTKLNRAEQSFINSIKAIDGIIVFDLTRDNKIQNALISHLNLVKNNFVRITSTNVITNKYKQTKIVNNTTLYSVFMDSDCYFLMPLNTLDKHETYEYSYNQNNNNYNTKEYYIDKINFRKNTIDAIRNSKNKTESDKKDDTYNARRLNLLSKAEIDKVSSQMNFSDININDKHLMMKLYNSSDEILQGGVKKLINGLNNHIDTKEDGEYIPYVQYNPNFKLNTILPQGTSTNQFIKLSNGEIIEVKIEHQKITDKLITGLNNARKNNNENKEYQEVITALNEGNISTDSYIQSKNIQLYRITKVENNKTKQEELIRQSTTSLILDGDADVEIENNSAFRNRSISSVAYDIGKEISYKDRKDSDALTERFVKEMQKLHINLNMIDSIDNNLEDVYKHAAHYYQNKASYLINQLDKFYLAGEPYSMDDPKLYENLIHHTEYFTKIANIILEGITFGNRISDIFNLDIKTEDIKTKNNIESIKNSIDSVRKNKILRDALNNLINIYFKNFSTNPLINTEYENPITNEITKDLLTLRETFGDLEALDAWIADPSEAPNNEVQVILKQVYKMITQAELFDAKRNVEEYEQQLQAIEDMEGTIDINKVIDFNTFSLHKAYNDKYLEDRRNIVDEYNEAYAKRNESYEDFVKYIKAKFKKEQFIHRHQEQFIVPEYYEKLLDIQNKAMVGAGDVYYKYLYLQHQLYNVNENLNETDQESSERKRNLKAQINQLKSDFDELGNLKSADQLAKIKLLNEYIETRKDLSKTYFDKEEHYGFQEIYIKYKKYIDNYNNKFPNKNLDEKLEDLDYREAYNWIKNNGHIGFTEEMRNKLANSFKVLTKRQSTLSNSTKLKLKSVPGAIDELGNIDPTKLTDEQIEEIRNEEANELSRMYDEGLGEAMLIKIIPDDVPIMKVSTKNERTNNILKQLRFKDNNRKTIIIGKINDILKKAIDRNTGKINIAYLFNNDFVTSDERDELGNLYEELRSLRNDSLSIVKKRKNNVYEDLTNDSEYYTALNYYNIYLKDYVKESKQFFKIFTEIDFEGNLIPNLFLYGYRMPKENFIDEEKTNAKKFIDENVDFVPTEKYFEASRDALSRGAEEYDKWFKLNHIYNPYTHKYQPLKIWTRIEAKPESELSKSIKYIPSDDNMEYFIKDEFKNTKYNNSNNNYKRGDIVYDNTITLNRKEEALRNLLYETVNKYASTYQGKKFANKGYLPRQRETEKDTRWVFNQVASLFGVSWHSKTESDDFKQNVNYTEDRDADFDMLSLIKAKGTKKYEPLPNKIGKTEEEYNKELKAVRERNRKITEENLKIDNLNINKNWKEVMIAYINNATIFNAKQSTKPLLYLLIEDLAINNAYMLKGIVNKELVKDSSPLDDTRYKTTPQTNMQRVIHNQARRIIYGHYHEKSLPRTVANFLQNMTSAKYMVFNGYGGIANVAIGKVNINMEIAANEYFGFADFKDAEKEYLLNSLHIISSIYSDKAPNKTVAFIKKFNIVNFDDMNQFASGSDNLEENIKRVRDFMYSFQSIGEHYMQNSVLLAMLKSNRLYTDSKGVKRIGDFKDYIWDIEQKAMMEAIGDNIDLIIAYQRYLTGIKHNAKYKLDLETGRKDFNRSFLYTLRDNEESKLQNLYKTITEKYNKKREELIEKEKKEFYKNPTVESLFEFKNGTVELKVSEIEKFNENGKNAIGSLENLISEFKNKVIAVNHKIHGVYDKNGAAMLEQKWFGSLVMQYHKHLWTGIMKRYRRKGYYSEFRGSRERGSYQDMLDFLGTEFTNFNSRVKTKTENGENIALASIQVAMKSILNSLTNIQFNWNNLSRAEKSNIRRNLGEMSGVLVSCLLVIALFGMNDDDDIKDDKLKSSLLYIADRIYTDTTMYTPIGLFSEYKTAWSSPIAAANGPSDLFKAMTLIPQYLFDPDFEVTYKSGRYAGENKFHVLFRRNLPAMRPLYQFLDITNSTEYYKVGQSQIGINASKRFGEMLNDL